MIQKGNFLLMEKSEFKDWLEKQKVTRTINKLQVHHTASPNYTTRKMVNGVAQQDHFKCLEGMRDFHIKDNGWSATGQNLTIFEDGCIALSLDRDLNQTPAGIGYANSGMICIENIGNFDVGGDKMTDKQKEAIIHVYACLANKLNIKVNTDNIVYHAWYKADGTRLHDYIKGQSKKTCPGTAFFGGNTVASAKKNFIPLIQVELDRLNKKPEQVVTPPSPTSDIPTKIIFTVDNSVENGFMRNGSNYIPASTLRDKLGDVLDWNNTAKTLKINGQQVTTIMLDGVNYVSAQSVIALGHKVTPDTANKKLYVSK